jgi:hypothetical protein
MNIVTLQDELAKAGAVVYWSRLQEVSRDTLAAALQDNGINEDEAKLPELPGPVVALRRAVKDQQTRTKLVRSLKGTGWAIVQENASENDIDFEKELIIRLDKVGRVTFDSGYRRGGADSKVTEAIEKAYQHYLNVYASTTISTWLVNQVDRMRGTALRDSGGFYYIPPHAVEHWISLKIALNYYANCGKLYRIPAVQVEDVVEAVLDSITDEIEKTAAKLDEALAEGSLGARALQNRADGMEPILNKVEEYEKILGVKLDTLKDRVCDLRASFAAAAAAADDEEEAV